VLALGRPGGHRAREFLAVVTDHPGRIRAEQPADRLGRLAEDLRRRQAARDQRRDPPQRRMLIREPTHLGLRFAIGDRGRHQLGELREARLGDRGQRLELFRGSEHRAPETPGDDDRNADPRMDPDATEALGNRPVEPRVVVDASWPAALANDGDDVSAVERPTRPDSKHLAPLREAGALGRCAVVLIAHDVHQRDMQGARDLLGDDGEEAFWWGSARHEGRHPP
jgi:hypothetical protein